MAIRGALDTTDFVPGGPYDACFSRAPRPGAVVAIAGCYFEFTSEPTLLDRAQYGTGDARMVLVGGADAENCAAWQAKDAAASFAPSGRDATYLEIPDANLVTLIGRELVDGAEAVPPDRTHALRLPGPLDVDHG